MHDDSGPKIHISNFPEMPSRKQLLYRSALRAAWIGLLFNLLLGLGKLTGGWLTNSTGLISDAANSLSDSISSVIVIIALVAAQLPADANHPYGHAKAESVAGLIASGMIILSALLVVWQAIHGWGKPLALPPVWTLWIAGGSAAIQEGLYRYKLRAGARTGSRALIVNAWDHRADALSSLAVTAGLGAGLLHRDLWPVADQIAGLSVAGVILITGVRLLFQCSSELMDQQADPDLVAALRKEAGAVDGVMDVEKLWARKTGLEIVVEIHIEVDPTIPVNEGHRIAHDVKRRLLQQFARLGAVVVHVEPYESPTTE